MFCGIKSLQCERTKLGYTHPFVWIYRFLHQLSEFGVKPNQTWGIGLLNREFGRMLSSRSQAPLSYESCHNSLSPFSLLFSAAPLVAPPMNRSTLAFLGATSLLMATGWIMPAQADNPAHTQQLLSTKRCAGCDLSDSGLVFAQLLNADMSNANLMRANLSRANLQGADLRGANLMGASLNGANLMGAKLDGANLAGADLRGAYLAGATLNRVTTENALLQGAIGLPDTLGRPEDYYQWAMEDAKRGNHASAIVNFTKAIERNPKFAQAYLGRAVSKLQLNDKDGAIADSQTAETLYKGQGDAKSAEVVQAFVKELQTPPKQAEQKSGNGIGTALLGLVGGLLQFLPMFLF